MPHTFTTNFGTSNFNSTPFTNNPFKSDALVFSTCTFPILLGPEDLFTKQAILFRLQRSVIDCLWLLYFPIGPSSN